MVGLDVPASRNSCAGKPKQYVVYYVLFYCRGMLTTEQRR